MKFVLLALLLLKSLTTLAQHPQDSIIKRIVMVGSLEYGKTSWQAVVEAVKASGPMDNNNIILFLGDNDANLLKSATEKINKTSGASAIVLPGEREWNHGKRAGYDSIDMLPKNDCPGPEEIKLGDDAVLILLNTQWWLHSYDKPGIESDCPTRSKKQVYEELDKILRENYDKLVIVAGHHPLESNGIAGGYYTLKQHLFPLTDFNRKLYLPIPLAGSLYPIIQNAFPGEQKLMDALYGSMINDLKMALSVHPNLIYVSGHEKNLQLLKDHTRTYLISGSASTSTRVSRSKRSLYTSEAQGFAIIEVYENKQVKAIFYEMKDGHTIAAYNQQILDFSKLPPLEDTTTVVTPMVPGKIKLPASTQYQNPTRIQKWLLGSNYRKEWETPVQLPVFDFKKEKGGFTIQKLGGGKQTKSLHLEDANGKQYKLRTIDKDPNEFLPAPLRSGLTQRIVKDYMSAQHPYGALVVAALARQTGVVEAQPQYFFVPNDTAFGYYRPLLANKMAMLVEKDPYPFEDTKGSFGIQNIITEKADHVVDQQKVLRARLLDILVGDFDRHMDQWSWGSKDTGKGKLYEPIPNDRDAAFFHSDGQLVKLAARNNLSLFRGFSSDLSNIVGLGFSADEFDHTFLNALDEDQWKKIISEFQNALPDVAIEAAVKQLPPEIYAIRGKELETKLKSRRSILMERTLPYYRAISEHVNVLGSNQSDYFMITQNSNQLQVRVYEWKQGDSTMLTYLRTFDPAVTKEVRLYGLNGNDHFFVDSTVQKGIRLRIIGGKGQDTFLVKGTGTNFIYDLSSEANLLHKGSHTRDRMSSHPDVNEFQLNSYTYRDKGRIPFLTLAASSEYGLQFGVGASKRTYGFRKEPFATETALSVHYAPSRNAYGLKFSNVLNTWIYATGLMVQGEVQRHAIQNFFGLGNETKPDRSKGFSYYRIQYNYAIADLMFTKNHFDQLSFALGPSMYYYWNNKEDKQSIIMHPNGTGLDSSSVYDNKLYLGEKLQLNVNRLDNILFPTQGISWKNEFTCYQEISEKKGSAIVSLQSHMLLAASLADTSKLVTLIKVGGGHIFSKGYEFFQALGLGTGNNLRGFRNYRFAGSSLLYGSMELRYKLLSLHSFLLPGEIGLLGFTDVGRVWTKHTSSQLWHTAYGGGIYFFPFQRFLLSASIGKNEDGAIYNFSLGKTINWYR